LDSGIPRVALDAGPECGSIVDRRYDLDGAVLDAHLDAEAAEFALGRDLQILVPLGVEIIGMRVKPVHHSVDRFLDQLLVRDGLDIIALDPAEHSREQLQVLVRNRQLGLALGDHREIERKQYAENGAQPDQPRLFPVVHRLFPLPDDEEYTPGARTSPRVRIGAGLASMSQASSMPPGDFSRRCPSTRCSANSIVSGY
jgi:hypothetical protein